MNILRNIKKNIFIIIFIFTSIPACFAQGELKKVINQTLPTIVQINTKKITYQNNNKTISKGVSSGVIFDAKNGYIITNEHNIRDIQGEITIELYDGRYFPAAIIGKDQLVDLAVLKINAPDLKAIPFGNKEDVHVGDEVLVIGSAFGFKDSVTKGVVSALQRGGIEATAIENYIQTDASINPGNSGGPLVNLKGQMIGVNVSMFSPARGNVGIGFAIPIDIVKTIIDKILKSGQVSHSTLGIKVVDLQSGMADILNVDTHHGAIIVQVMPYSPAALAGLEMGDIITEMSGKRILTASQLQSNIHLLEPGKTIEYTIIRKNNEAIKKEITVKNLVDFNTEIVEKNRFLNDLNIENTNIYNPIWGLINGVKITYIRPNSLASLNGLKVDDVILAINFISVHNIKDAQQVLQEIKQPSMERKIRVFMTVLRGFDVLVFNHQAENSQDISFINYI